MRARKILLVDDGCEFRKSVRKVLAPLFEVVEAESAAAFRQVFRPFVFDLVILDMRLEAGREGLGLLREILAQDELQAVIMVSAYGDTDAVIEATEGGALMFLHKKEFTPELLARLVEAVLQQARVRRHLASLQRRVRVDDPLSLTSGNAAVRKATQQVERAADFPESVVIISGEPGAGHDLAAAGIHDRSAKRRTAPCVAAPADGAGAGAVLGNLSRTESSSQPRGLFLEAHGGVLFVGGFDRLPQADRRAILTAAAQRRVESVPEVRFDVQLALGVSEGGAGPTAALAKELIPDAMLVEVALPPLRDRREDIPLLAAYFLQGLRRTGQTTARSFTRPALDAIEAWSWPGNLVEMRAAVSFAGVQAMVAGSDEIERRHLPMTFDEAGSSPGNADIKQRLARFEAGVVAEAIEKNASANKTQLAEILGYTDRFTLTRRMKNLLGKSPEIGKEFPKIVGKFGT